MKSAMPHGLLKKAIARMSLIARKATGSEKSFLYYFSLPQPLHFDRTTHQSCSVVYKVLIRLVPHFSGPLPILRHICSMTPRQGGCYTSRLVEVPRSRLREDRCASDYSVRRNSSRRPWMCSQGSGQVWWSRVCCQRDSLP